MKYRNKKSNSLIIQIIMHFVVCLLLGLGLYWGIGLLYDHYLELEYPTIEYVMNYTKGVETDNWKGFYRYCPNGRLLVYDSAGNCIYYTDEEMEEIISLEDLELIYDISSEDFLRLMTSETEDGRLQYILCKVRYTDDGLMNIIESVVLDENYQIISGDTFLNRTGFTEHEMDIIQGIYQQDYDIIRGSYYNQNREKRTLVLITPIIYSGNYNAMQARYRLYNFSAVALFMLICMICVFHLWIIIRNDIRPLLRHVSSYSSGTLGNREAPQMLHELQPISDAVTSLIDQVEDEKETRAKEEQTRRRIIASLSHDLKTPIAVIMGYTQALSDGHIQESDRAQYYEMMMDKCQMAVDMIDSMAEYTKMEHPDFQITKEKTEVGEFVRQYLMSIYDRLVQNQIDLYPEIPDEEIYANIDRRMILRVLNNLISNTRKYNPDGCRMRIIVSREKDQLILAVADDGIGIQEDLRETVFQAFITSNEARTTGQGTGLGLSIVDMAVKAHKGTIELKKEGNVTDGYITEFEIRIPVDLPADSSQNR